MRGNTFNFYVEIDHVRPKFVEHRPQQGCAVCGAIGAVVNLPWNEAPSRRTMTQIFGEPAAETIDDAAGFEGPGSFAGDPMRDGEAEGTHESPRNRREARAAPRRFSISRREALRLLGLEWQASADDVRQAYRRLARESHPDQFASEGDAAVAAATERFKQIKEAYELLEMEMDAGAETT